MAGSSPNLDDLRSELEELLTGPEPEEAIEHAEWMAHISGIICEAFERYGLEATVVGGGAVEFHAPGAHVSRDSDFVVEPRIARERLGEVFSRLGFRKGTARHWIWDDRYFVEVPSTHLEGESEEHTVHTHTLRVVKKECVLAERVVEYYSTGHTGWATQAIEMIEAFGDEIDDELLNRELGTKPVQRTYKLLERLVTEGVEITDTLLREKRQELRKKGTSS